MTHFLSVGNAFQNHHTPLVPCRIELCRLPDVHNMQEALKPEELMICKSSRRFQNHPDVCQFVHYNLLSCDRNQANKIHAQQDNLTKEILMFGLFNDFFLCITFIGKNRLCQNAKLELCNPSNYYVHQSCRVAANARALACIFAKK